MSSKASFQLAIAASAPKPPAMVPVARPATTVPAQPGLVNWRLVGVVGGAAWLCVTCLIAGVWAVQIASRSVGKSAKEAVAEKHEAVEPEKIAANAWPKTVEQAAPAMPPVERVAPIPTPVASAKTKTPEDARLDRKQEDVAEDVAVQLAGDGKKAPAQDPKAPEKLARCGTAVDFFDDPTQAMKKAKESEKLLFLVHVAGDFEDPGFT